MISAGTREPEALRNRPGEDGAPSQLHLQPACSIVRN